MSHWLVFRAKIILHNSKPLVMPLSCGLMPHVNFLAMVCAMSGALIKSSAICDCTLSVSNGSTIIDLHEYFDTFSTGATIAVRFFND